MVRRFGSGVSAAMQFWQRKGTQIRTDEELIDAAGHLFALRQRVGSDSDRDLARAERKASRTLHAAVQNAPKDIYLVQIARQHKLSRTEREVLLALVASALGVCDDPGNLAGIQCLMHRGAGELLRLRRAMSPAGKLVREGLIEIETSREDRLKVRLSSDLLSRLVHKERRRMNKWDARDYRSCLNLLKDLGRVASDQSSEVEAMQDCGQDDYHRLNQHTAVERFDRNMKRLCAKNPKWPLNWLMNESRLIQEQRLAVLILVAKELGFVRPSERLDTGQGLAGAMCHSPGDFARVLEMLKSDGALIRHGHIQVCGGDGDNVEQEDEWALRRCTFELTDNCIRKLEIGRRHKTDGAARPATVKMEQLVLSERVRRALEMCVAQAKHSKVLLEDWGLGERFSYGSSVAMLFSGPPGTGKTACAEALAGELGKPIMVMSYAELQNCWVGQTEKNVVRAFREASRQDTVLFWDEADAVFGDRERAHQNWEVREVNVLLQELERFKGVCILATNRKLSLDKALERRIAMKVEFERPARHERLEIWRRLLPQKLPLGADVDIRTLAEEDLSGGQIKNVIMNAARMAIANGPDARVMQADFAKALAMENNGGWSEARGGFGFAKKTVYV